MGNMAVLPPGQVGRIMSISSQGVRQLMQEVILPGSPACPERDEGQTGQGLVEFALVLPILLLVVLGFIGFGNVMRQINAMNNAADAGAFYASLGHDHTEVVDYVRLRLSQELVNPDRVELDVTPTTYSYGDIVTVTITRTMVIDAVFWEATFPIPVQASEIVQKEVGP